MPILVTEEPDTSGATWSLAYSMQVSSRLCSTTTTGDRRIKPSGVPFIAGNAGVAISWRGPSVNIISEVIVHFAASSVVSDSVRDPMSYYQNNTANSQNLIEAAIACGVLHNLFIHAAVYGYPRQFRSAKMRRLGRYPPMGHRN